MLQKIAKLISCVLLAAVIPAHAAELAFHVTSKAALPGDVKWDYLSFDVGSKRLYITHGDHVDVYDTEQNRVVETSPGTEGVHGVALAPDLDRGFTSNGASSTVTIFELSSLKVLGTLPTEKKPDAIVYDPHTQRVFVANGDSGTLTVIDAKELKVIGTVDIGGKLEFEAVDGKGLLFVNIEDRNLLAVVDTEKLTVTARHDLAAGCLEPTGLSIDAATERLFVGCRNEKMMVVAGLTGKILASVPVGKGCDATAYDIGLNLAFASSGDGTLTVLSGESYAVVQTVATQPTARTMALDAAGHRIYTVAADFDAPLSPGTRPKLKPGTFTLISVAR
jgi:YVTN family beta-propeller protein